MTLSEGISFTRARALLVVGIVSMAVVAGASPARAATFTVTSTAAGSDLNLGNGTCETLDSTTDTSVCTLRAAIEEANQTPERDDISFNIPGEVPHTIRIAANKALPVIAAPVRILGYTEPGATTNTIADPTQGTNASLRISLRGSGIGSHGLILNQGAAGSVISGLAIANFHDGLLVGTGVADVKLTGNFIGTDAFGVVADGNYRGIHMLSSDTTVGGTNAAARNLISANDSLGIQASGDQNLFLGNVMGTMKDASTPRGNGTSDVPTSGGMLVTGNRNVIGDTDLSDGATGANVIAYSGSNGILVFEGNGSPGPARRNRISANRIFSSGDLGIDLRAAGDRPGRTLNDLGDADTGGNALQNFPVLKTVNTVGFRTTIAGTLSSKPSSETQTRSYIIQFFRVDTPDDSGFGEGEVFLGQTSVETNSNGTAKFSFAPSRSKLEALGDYVTATATDALTGDTSEFSRARIASAEFG